MAAAIETFELTRRFGKQLAVDGVSLSVPERSVYGFLGRNGAGKTTTLKLLLGLLHADAGTARIAGIDVAVDRLGAARKVGSLLEAHGFYANLSGRENLDLSRRLLGLPITELARVLEITEMSAHAGRRVADYSLGMRQRLGLARAVLGAPPVLILDEPTNGLDPEGIADMRSFLRDLPARADTTVMLSSHLLSEIEQTATHVGVLSRGKLVLQGVLAELKAELPNEVVIGTDMPEQTIAVAHAQGIAIEHSDDVLVARFAPRADPREAIATLNHALCMAGVRVHTLAPRQLTLETLYRQASVPADSSS